MLLGEPGGCELCWLNTEPLTMADLSLRCLWSCLIRLSADTGSGFCDALRYSCYSYAISLRAAQSNSSHWEHWTLSTMLSWCLMHWSRVGCCSDSWDWSWSYLHRGAVLSTVLSPQCTFNLSRHLGDHTTRDKLSLDVKTLWDPDTF